MVKFCELCGDEAHLHCAADSAFLCRSCDADFHASNILFSRHIRRIICPICKSLTGDFVSGSLLPWLPTTTTTCCLSSLSSSSSSSVSSCCSSLDCVSSTEVSSTRKKSAMSRARGREVSVKDIASGVFVDWCNRLGLNGDLTNAVVSLASLALALEERRMRPRETTGKKKVILAAAAFWFGVKNTHKTTMMLCPSLKKVEEVTGVAAGMIRAVESKLARAMSLRLRRWRVDSEEGWAENDNV